MLRNPFDEIHLSNPRANCCLQSLRELVNYVTFFQRESNRLVYSHETGAVANAWALFHAVSCQPDILGMTICHEYGLDLGKPYFKCVVDYFKKRPQFGKLSTALHEIESYPNLKHVKEACNEMKHHRLLEFQPYQGYVSAAQPVAGITVAPFSRNGCKYPERDGPGLAIDAQRFFLEKATEALTMIQHGCPGHV